LKRNSYRGVRGLERAQCEVQTHVCCCRKVLLNGISNVQVEDIILLLKQREAKN